MNLNQSRGTDTFLTEYCPVAAKALYFLSLKLTLYAFQTEMSCILVGKYI
jgi:hypothetical protein